MKTKLTTKQKVTNILVKGGFNPKDVDNMVERWFDDAVRWGYDTPKHIADAVSSLWSQNP